MRTLVVEDEPDIAEAITSAMRAAGYATDHAPDVAAARLLTAMHEYDLAVVDRRLPDGDGLDLCRAWRAEGLTLALLVLTALDGTEAIVEGLGAGADDYLVKPFAAPELVARVQALLRRAPVAPRPRLTTAGLDIDRAQRRVRRDGVVVSLTSKEFALLEGCWDHAAEPGSNVVDVHVRALRRKLGDGVIETVRGAGYRIGAE